MTSHFSLPFSLLLLLILFSVCLWCRLGLLAPNLLNQLLDTPKSLLLLLGTQMPLIDLFDDQLLNLLLHNRRLLFDDFLRLPGLLLNQSTILPLQLPDQLLDLALFLLLVSPISAESFDTSY